MISQLNSCSLTWGRKRRKYLGPTLCTNPVSVQRILMYIVVNSILYSAYSSSFPVSIPSLLSRATSIHIEGKEPGEIHV